jgi:hypothetical protein
VLAGANTRAPKSACIKLNHGFDPASVLLQVYPPKIPYLAPEPLSHPWTRRSTSDPCAWMTLILLWQAYRPRLINTYQYKQPTLHRSSILFNPPRHVWILSSPRAQHSASVLQPRSQCGPQSQHSACPTNYDLTWVVCTTHIARQPVSTWCSWTFCAIRKH